MLKLSQNALGMLIAKYRSVLKKMFIKNSAALAASVLIFSAAPAQAADFAVGTNQSYANLAALAAAVDAGTAVFLDGDTITIHNADASKNTTLNFSGKNVTIKPKDANIQFLNMTNTTVTLANAEHVYIEGFTGYSAAYLMNSALTANGATFTGNMANGGGTAYLYNSALTADNATFEGNTANNGGAAYLEKNSTLTANYANFTGNTATYFGGAAYLNSSTLTANGATFSGNTANYDGGAAYLNSSVLTADNATFTGNTANNSGGAAHLTNSSTLTANNATFEGNTANYSGGAAHLTNSSTLTANNATFEGNTANYGGAASLYTSALNADNATFASNSANYDGGAAFLYSSALTANNATFTDNKASGSGGAAYLDTSTLTADSATFTGNTADYGGAAYIENSTLTADNATFESNSANGFGGAALLNNSTLNANNATFTGNTAESGGAAHIENNSTLNANNATFTGNKATGGGGYGYGGAVYLTDNSTLTANNATFTGNEANYGGAAYLENNSALNADNATFEGNTADLGGAAYLNTSTLTADNANFTGNTASNNGGAAYLYDSTLTADNATFTGNSAYSGGAAFLDSSTLTVDNATFAGNTASYGGAIYIFNGSTVNLNTTGAGKTTSFIGNTAGGDFNSLFFDGIDGVTNYLNVTGAGTLDMRDQMNSMPVTDYNIKITKDGTGDWKLRGANFFYANGDTGTTFEVKAGTLDLYNDANDANNAEIYIDKGSFTLKDGAVLISRGDNIIRAETIHLEGGSTLGFDLSEAVANDTTNLYLDGTTLNVNPVANLNIDILALNGDGTSQTFALVKADGISKDNKTLTLRGEDFANTRATGVLSDFDGNLLLTTDAENGVVTWTGGDAQNPTRWDATSKNWDTADVDGDTSQKFLHGDAVVFDGAGGEIVIQEKGVQIAQQSGNPCMTIKSGDWTFTGGKIEGGEILFVGDGGSIAFDTRSLEQLVIVAPGVEATISAISGETLTFNGLSAISGGAIWGGVSSIINIGGGTVFANNWADYYGGAIYSDSDVNIDGSNAFRNNTAKLSGGAILGNNVSVSGDGASFTGNYAADEPQNSSINAFGGAILGDNVSVSGNNASFTGNYAAGETAGGSVWTAGGAIYGDTDVKINGNGISFTGNYVAAESQISYADATGGAIYGENEVNISGKDIFFTGNYAAAKSADDDAIATGGAVYGKVVVNISGYGISFTGNYLSAESVYDDAIAYGGAVFSWEDVNVTGDNISFTNNSVAASSQTDYSEVYATGGAIFGEKDVIISGTGISFDRNYAYAESSGDDSKVVAAGGAILGFNNFNSFNNEVNISGTDISFTGNYAAAESTGGAVVAGGGAIHGQNDVNASGENFSFTGNYAAAKSEDNNADAGGGAIYGENEVNINGDNFSFSGNYAAAKSEDNIADAAGGAIYSKNKVSINGENFSFSGNYAAAESESAISSAEAYGGAIYSLYDVTVEGDNISFTNNSAVASGDVAFAYGGAIYADENLTIRGGDIVFQGNKVIVNNVERPNAVYMYNYGDGKILTLAALDGKTISFFDPVESNSTEQNLIIDINKPDTETYTGTVLFDTHHSKVYGYTTVYNGTMELANGATYGVDSTGSFVLGEWAPTPGVKAVLLSDANSNTIKANYIDLYDNGVLAFNMDKADSTTTNLILEGDYFDWQDIGAGEIKIYNETTPLTNGTYTLVKAEGATFADTGEVYYNDVLKHTRDENAMFLNTDTTNLLKLDVVDTTGQTTLTWTGGIDGNWDDGNNATRNWDGTVGGYNVSQFQNGDDVIFDDSSFEKDITVQNAGVEIGDMTVSNTAGNDYSFSGGSIGGAGSLTKDGAGELTFNNSNTYSGGTTLKEGIINIGADSALGGGAVAMKDTTILDFNGSYSIGNQINIDQGATVELVVGTGNEASITGKIAGGSFDKTGRGKLTVGEAAVTNVDVQEGHLQIAAGKTLAAEGSFDMGNNTILSVDAGTTAVRAGSVSFGQDSTLNMSGYSGSQWGDPDVTLITSNTAITGLSGNYTIGGSSTSVDYLTSQVRLSEDKKSVLGSIYLTWYDGHQDPADSSYDKAHGTFTLDAGESFTLGTKLEDRTGTFTYLHPETNIWDGKTLSKEGAGTLILTGDNTYTGGTDINAGTIIAQSATALGTGEVRNDAALTLNFNGTFANQLSGSGSLSSQGNISINRANAGFSGATSIDSGTLTLGNANALGTSQIQNNTALALNFDGAFANQLSGSGSLSSQGNVSINRVNAGFSGATSINSGTLTLGNANALGTSQIQNNAGLVLSFNGTFANQLSGSGSLSTTGNIAINRANTGFSGATTIGSGVLTLGNANALGTSQIQNITGLALNFTGTFTNQLSGSGGLSTAGNIAINHANGGFTGTTTIDSGVLTLGNDNALGTSQIQNDAGLALNFTGTFANQLSGSGGLSAAGDIRIDHANSGFSGTTTISSDTLTLSNIDALGSGNVENNANLEFDLTQNDSFDRQISGSGNVIKSGGDELILTGTNTYSGTTVIYEGTLTGNIAANTVLAINNGAAYNNGGGSVAAADRSFSDLSGSGDINMQGKDLTINGGGDFSGVISGTGTSLIKDGAGTLTLSGVNTYSGATVIDKGTLEVQNVNALGISGNIENNSVLNLFSSYFSNSTTTTYTINNYSGTGVVGLQASATSSDPADQWSDLLNFTATTPTDTVNVHFHFSPGSSAAYIPDEGLNFAKLASDDGTDTTFKLDGVSSLAGAYQLGIKTEDNQNYNLISTFDPSVAKVYSEASAATMGHASAMHGGTLFKAVSEAAGDAGKNASGQNVTGVYAGMGRGDARYETGSHADVKGNTFALALAWEANEKTTWGIFGQKFYGSYTTTHEAALSGGNRTIHSDGDLESHDIGLFAEYRPKGQNKHEAGHYYIAIAKAGRSSNDFRSDNYGGRTSSFSSGRSVLGLSLGGGYVKNTGNDRTAEYYSHFIYTKMGSDNLTDSIGQNINFDSAHSVRLLSGARLNFNQSKKTSAYFGAALDYEFSGKNDAYIDGNKANGADLKGLTGILELGLRAKQSETLTVDLGLQGYVGKKRGLGGSLTLSKKF